MPLRFVLLGGLLPLILGAIAIYPIWGIYLFVGLFYLSPQSFFWGLAAFRLPLMTAGMTLLASLRLGPNTRAPFPGQMLLLILFLVMALVSAAFAEESFETAWPELELMLKTGIFCLLLCRVIRSLSDMENVMWASLASILPLALWGIRQYYAGNYRLEQVGGGQLMDSTSLSAAFVFLIPFSLLYAGDAIVWKRWLARVSVPALFIATILTYTRASSLALLFYGLYALLRFRRYMVRNLIVLGLIVGLVAAFAPEDYWDRMQTITHFFGTDAQESAPITDWRRSEDINSGANRLAYWKAGLDMFFNHPVFGVGINHFPVVIARYIPGEFHVTHNTYLQLLAETGLCGFLPFMAMLILTFYNLSFCQRRAALFEAPQRMWRFCEAARMGLLGFMICMFFISRQSYEPLYWLITLSAIGRSLCLVAARNKSKTAPSPDVALTPAFGRSGG